MSKVTVIVPVCNGAPYLRTAMDALAAQTLQAWTAVCVDDGSTDGSAEILDHYAARDPRLAVVRQANAGASAARNAGLARATGEIVAFLDADDVPGPDWLARLHAGIEGVDLVWGGGIVNENGIEKIEVPHDVGASYDDDEVRQRVWTAVFGYRLGDLVGLVLPGGLWKRCRRELGGLYWRAFRRDVIGNLRFDTRLRLYEDAMFLAAYARRAKSMRVIGNTGYRYFIRETGSMLTETREQLVANKFALRDARKELDPEMTQWRGTYVLSALQVLKATRSLREMLRYLRFRS